jgi:hypothetical protein
VDNLPKFKKHKDEDLKQKKISDRGSMLKSVRISAILAGIFLILSLLFNGTEFFFEGITTKYIQKDVLYEILDNTIKVSVILFSFVFMMVSLGNYKEFTGKPVKFKEILFLFCLSIVQTIRSLIVFIFTLIVLVIVIFYLYVIQEG